MPAKRPSVIINFGHRRFLFLMLVIVCFPGCAFGNHGTLLTRRTMVKNAEILDVYAVGLLLRTSSVDGGFSLGYRHATFIYPLEADLVDASERGSEWFWFRAPLRTEHPLLRASTSIGLETQFTPEIKRFGLGYLDQVLIDGGAADESRVVKLSYNRDAPANTILHITHPKN